MKGSFILYHNYARYFKKLNFEQCGRLIMAIFAHECGGEAPELDMVTDLLYTVISDQLERDGKTYEEICMKRAEAGKKGGIASGKARSVKSEANEANVGDNVNENENVNENGNENENENENEGRSAGSRGGYSDWVKKQNARVARERFYAIRRQRAERAVEKVLERAREDEQFAEAEREIRERELAHVKAEIAGKDIVETGCALEESRRKRAEAMVRLKITEQDFQPKFSCPKCSDTGFLPDGHICDCYFVACKT